jgi:tRNA threonylcarbamoyladenosine biosynthesis protein TsaB
MILLAADTSCSSTSLALMRDGEILTMRADGAEPSASRMFVLLDAVLHAAGVEIESLNCLAVGAGPGSFTGLRVSFAAMRMLAWARGIPLFSVNSLEALAWPYRTLKVPLAIVQPARRGHVYQMAVQAGSVMQDVQFLSFDEASARILTLGKDAYLAGMSQDICSSMPKRLPVIIERDGPDAADIARMAALRFEAGERPILEDVLPLYLRPSDAEVVAAENA